MRARIIILFSLLVFSFNAVAGENTSGASSPACRPPRFALRSNILSDLLLIPDLGAELYIGSGWSVSAGASVAHVRGHATDRRFYFYGGDLAIRRYFSSNPRRPMSGHHLGIYAQAFSYDMERSYKGSRSDLSYAAGLLYGYTIPLGRFFSMDFSLGVGYLGGKYKEYRPQDGHLVWQSTRRRHWLGPTMAGVALVWHIGGHACCRKGGPR